MIAALRRHAGTCEEARKNAEYFSNNRERMNYPKFRAMGLCVATGVVEGGCKHIVGARLKHGGMRWTVAGANAIIALRCAVESNRFDDFWERRASGNIVNLTNATYTPWLVLDGLTPMMQALDNGKELWVCPRTHLVGFLRTSMSSLKDETIWTRFGLSAQQAATRAGFPKRIAAQLVAAIGELHSNIYEHSEATGTGLVAYRACPGQFELAVSDSGVGVLESLRTGPDYAALQDHGEALRLTLTSGISRFGSKSHRGHGFRPLFVGLANLNGALRFRSGDHALLIEGRNPSLTTARPAQKPDLQGFCVSVSCVTV